MGLPGSPRPPFQQLLYYPPGAPGYASHRDCRDDAAAAAAAAGGAAPQERAFTTLLYLSDNASINKFSCAWCFHKAARGTLRRVAEFEEWQMRLQPHHTPRAGVVWRRAGLVLQRHERAPYLPGPNAHGEPWTRCSLGEDGSVDSCRTYCASQRARAAGSYSFPLRFRMEAFTAHKSGLDPDVRAAAVEALSDALFASRPLAGQVLLAHAPAATGRRRRATCAVICAPGSSPTTRL